MRKPLAQQVDEWRVVPRLLVAWYCWLVYEVTSWAMHTPDLSVQAAAFAGGITAMLPAMAKWYFETGKRWTDV